MQQDFLIFAELRQNAPLFNRGNGVISVLLVLLFVADICTLSICKY